MTSTTDPVAATGHRTLADWEFLAAKCPRCSLCKFPPLSAVESARRSGICPAIDHYGFHSHSGGGRVAMGLSLLHGRSTVTPEARDAIFQCTMCGACDVSCKYSSDIEVAEILSSLRAEAYEQTGPLPAHRRLLENIEDHGHPYDIEDGRTRADWLGEAPEARVVETADVLLLVGAPYALLPERRATLLALVRLLDAAGMDVAVLGAREPDCGTVALQLGARAMFDRLATDAIDLLNASRAREIVCADAEDYATIRGHWPKVGALRPRVRHAAEVLSDAVAGNRLRPVHRIERRLAYHDPCSLGRRSEPHVDWEGEVRKVMGQLLVYDPPRPVNRGADGCYEAPRKVLRSIPGLDLVEFPRRREYSYCCGGSGGVPEAFPELAASAASERLDEAADVDADLVVTACPGCEHNLSGGTGPDVAGIYDVLAESVFGRSAR